MMKRRLSVLAIALMAGVALGACDREKPAVQVVPVEPLESSLNGLSREQMEHRARAMTPERAESLGIIDTTIHVEDLAGDTAIPPAAARGAGDTVAPD